MQRKVAARAAQSSSQRKEGASVLKFSADGDTFSVSPANVLVLALAYMGIVVALHIVGKLRGTQ